MLTQLSLERIFLLLIFFSGIYNMPEWLQLRFLSTYPN